MALSAHVRERIGRITNLPTLPQVATRLMETVNDAESSANESARLISQDPSLSAKVLKLANSAFYGIPRTVTNVNNAVVILGLNVIRTMVLSLTVFDMFPQDAPRALFDRQAFWRHSLGCALICRMLSGSLRSPRIDPEEAFCAGLIHDLGRIAMEQYLHDDFRVALAAAHDQHIPLHAAETKTLGCTHADIAEWLTAEWELPLELHVPLVGHHAPLRPAQCQDLAALCHAADALAYRHNLGLPELAEPAIDAEAFARLALPDDALSSLTQRLPEELDKLDVFLSLC